MCTALFHDLLYAVNATYLGTKQLKPQCDEHTETQYQLNSVENQRVMLKLPLKESIMFFINYYQAYCW